MRRNETPEKNYPARTNDLSPRQVAALPYLITTPTLTVGARLADVGRATPYRWTKDPRSGLAREPSRCGSGYESAWGSSSRRIWTLTSSSTQTTEPATGGVMLTSSQVKLPRPTR